MVLWIAIPPTHANSHSTTRVTGCRIIVSLSTKKIVKSYRYLTNKYAYNTQTQLCGNLFLILVGCYGIIV